MTGEGETRKPAGPQSVMVPREAAGARLDRFVSGAMGVSRAEVQRWIDAGRVMLEGVASDASAHVRAGQRIEVLPMARRATTALPDGSVAFDVLYEDDDLIVVYKPPGLVVHPAKGHEAGTLVNGLLARGYFRREDLGDDERPGIVHRLDKGTSGVMVVARTPEAREKLKSQFQAHTIERAYEAIVVGHAPGGSYDTWHGRHPHDRKRFTTRVKSGKRAVTHVQVLEWLEGATLVRCTLETGRTHQIRVHLAESGWPVVGDPLYGKPPRDPRVRRVAERLGHQALHARVLGFVHPRTGEPMRFELAPPADFVEALEALGPATGAP